MAEEKKEETKVKEEKEIAKTPEEAAKEMEEIVEKQEEAQGEIEKKEALEKLERADKRRETPEERWAREEKEKLDSWVPKTELGREVKRGKIKNIDEILDSGRNIMEPEIVDSLMDLETELLNIGQMKGKFGGGKRRAYKQTQKKTKENSIVTFAVLAVVGDGKGHIGIGFGRAAETLPAKAKAIRKAKLNIEKIRSGCGSYDCLCSESHSIPMSVSGKCSSVRVNLMPAPQGTGLVASNDLKKILRLAGVKDIYSRSFGKSRTTINSAKACLAALRKLNEVRLE